MESRRGVSSSQARSLYWLVATYIQLLLLVESSQNRNLQQASRKRRLQPYTDNTNTIRHGPAVTSFQVSDGSWVDCVRIEQQIASHHPTLKGHIIQISPPSYMNWQQNHIESQSRGLHPQLFAREHGGCPEGCIPVQRRDPKQPLLRKFHPLQLHEDRTPHEYATAGLKSSKAPYQGSSAVLSVNKPKLGKPKLDYSISQLWLVAGQPLNTIEVGWQVGGRQGSHSYPQLKTLLSPRLFIFWTADNYNITGCYDLTCSGFVQINNKWVLGGTLSTLNINTEKEQEISIVVAYDSMIPGWWLSISDTTIGYWPSSLYTALNSSATNLLWGGEVYPAGQKTTDMGSGAFPDKGYPLAAYQRCVKYADSSKTFFNATLQNKFVSHANCYNSSVQQGGFTDWGSYFFFGGPGCIKHP